MTLWHRVDGTFIVDDPARLDVDRIHRWLGEDAYWAKGRSRLDVEQSIAHSVVLGAFVPGRGQVGFCRWITDHTTFAYLCDVYVDPAVRGQGIGTWLVDVALQHPAVRDVNRQLLATADAHGLYAKFGFEALPEPRRWMTRHPTTS